jgi:LacI family transcriptional regulator
LNNAPDISPATKQRVQQICNEVGYVPNAGARQLVRGVSSTIGVVLPDIGSPAFSGMYKGIGRTLLEQDYALYLGDCDCDVRNEIRYIQKMMENRVGGILIAPVSEDVTHINRLVRRTVPVVYIGERTNDPAACFVAYDHYSSTRQALEYLYRLGHRRIALLAYRPSTTAKNERVRAYNDFMAAMRLAPVFWTADTDPGGMTAAGGKLARRHIALGESLPTAVLSVHDELAIGAVSAFRAAGVSVPGQISVMGSDDQPHSAMPETGLSTIHCPHAESGARAVGLLMDLVLRKPDIPTQIVLEAQLAIRGSTGAARELP